MSASEGTPPLPVNTYWVVPGRFAAGEYPGALDEQEARRKLRLLLNAGITTFIDLTTPADWLEPYADFAEDEANRRGVTFEHLRHEIVDLSVPRSPSDTAAILDAIDKALADDNKAVYLHCWGGVGRTGTIVGCWLVRRYRITGQQALDQIAEWWKSMKKRYYQPRSPETDQQRDYVRNWHEPPRPPLSP